MYKQIDHEINGEMSRKNKVLISRNIKRVSVQSRQSFFFFFLLGGGGAPGTPPPGSMPGIRREYPDGIPSNHIYVGNNLKAYQVIMYTSVIP